MKIFSDYQEYVLTRPVGRRTRTICELFPPGKRIEFFKRIVDAPRKKTRSERLRDWLGK